MILNSDMKFLLIASKHSPNLRDIQTLKQLIDDGIDWNAFISLVGTHRLFGPVHQTISTYLDTVVPVHIQQKIKSRYVANVRKGLKNTAEAIKISSIFKKHGIDHIFLKGLCLSQYLYGSPGFRHVGDIDLIIDDENIDEAMAIIEGLGYKQTQSQIPLNKERLKIFKRISHHLEYTSLQCNASIELHWRFYNVNQMFPISIKQAIKKHTTIHIQGHDLPTLCHHHTLMFLCLHGSKHTWERYFWIKDIHDYFNSMNTYHRQRFFNDAIEKNMARPVAEAFCLLNQLYGVQIPGELVKYIESNKNMKKALSRIFYLQQYPNTIKSAIVSYYHRMFTVNGIKHTFLFIRYLILMKRYIKRFSPDHQSRLKKGIKRVLPSWRMM